jgi:high affinity Mn2+ porin
MAWSKVYGFVALGIVVAAQGLTAHAQQTPQSTTTDATPGLTLLPHSDSTWWWLSGQMNFIGQAHGSFTSPYSGPHSFRAIPENALSRVLTLYTGARLPQRWQAIFDVESAGGQGLSAAFGLAGFTNLDVVRNPTLGSAPYLAHAMLGKIIALSTDYVDVTPTALALAPRLPARRLEIWGGKMSVVDFFDVNAAASDSHLQFTNWTVDNTGAYDYAADTRGYTYGLIVEYVSPRWALRSAEALMPTSANGTNLDWNVARARGENLELELLPTANLDVRMLGYLNHANMGSYTQAIDAFLAEQTPTPEIDAHPRQG